jgi:hypothetical protein
MYREDYYEGNKSQIGNKSPVKNVLQQKENKKYGLHMENKNQVFCIIIRISQV